MINKKVIAPVLIFIIIGSGTLFARSIEFQLFDTDIAIEINELIELAVANNYKLALIKEEVNIIQQRENTLERNVLFAFDANPELRIKDGDSRYSFAPGFYLQAEQEFLGGKFTAGLDSSYDLIEQGDFTSIFSLNYQKTLLDSRDEEIRNSTDNYQLYCNARQNLIKEIYITYFEILELSKSMEISQEKLSIAEMRIEFFELSNRAEKELESLKRQRDFQKEQVELEQERLEESYSKLNNLLNIEIEYNLPGNYRLALNEELQELDCLLKKAFENNNSIIEAEEFKGSKKSWQESDWQAVFRTGVSPLELTDLENNLEYYASINIGKSFSFNTAIDREAVDLDIKKSKYDLEQEKDIFRRQVENLYQQVKNQQEKLLELGDELKERKNEIKLLERKRDAGLIGLIEYREEDVNVQEEKINFLNSKINYIKLYLDLKILTGEDLYENRGVLIEDY
ncbi:TolC family protein [Natronospora cellulosivora (SeqCode)]